MRADLWGRDCWGRKTEKKVVGQSESRSPGRDCCRRKTEKRRWLDRVRADLQGEELLAKEG